jgi:SAM-dependent methyltransferase
MISGTAERRRLLGHVWRILRPGGQFILHVHNRWFNFWDPNGRRWLLRDLFRTLLGSPAAGDRLQPVHQDIAGLTLHLFTRREVVGLLRSVGFQVRGVWPVGLTCDARLPAAWWFGGLRAYGYLLRAERLPTA